MDWLVVVGLGVVLGIVYLLLKKEREAKAPEAPKLNDRGKG